MRKTRVQIGSALIAVVVGSVLCASTASAMHWTDYPDTDIPTMDLPPSPILLSPGTYGLGLCKQACERDPRCMAFTWVPRTPSECWIKASPRLFSNVERLRVHRGGFVSGVKVFTNKPCWARHLFNFKICDVVFHGVTVGSTITSTLDCPEPSRTAMVPNRAIPGRYDHYCVAKRDDDPGNLPNCTDAFGGGLHEAGVLGNHINHACLDAN